MEKLIPRGQSTRNSVLVSSNIDDIIAINKRSVTAKNGIRIIELGSLSDLIPKHTAEGIRAELLKNKVQVKQLTNHEKFESWTGIDEFVQSCLTVRQISTEILPINTEVLLFDNVVAIYQIEPEISVVIIENEAFAAQQRALFDNFWNIADPVQLNADGSTTYSVTIKRTPRDVYEYISDLSNWPQFSDFAKNFERVTDSEYIAHTSQGDITVKALFDDKRLLLDTECVLPDGNSDFIPYRVVPNKDGAELMMTNFKPIQSTDEEYSEQLQWMKEELSNIKQLLEVHHNTY